MKLFDKYGQVDKDALRETIKKMWDCPADVCPSIMQTCNILGGFSAIPHAVTADACDELIEESMLKFNRQPRFFTNAVRKALCKAAM